ncbi:MAG: LuxR family transcriptional regulator [Dehalococcoidia bacterium SG8_51_3]|nr:MAG: LuxR family transcriptional regulator [Dehalococcoidia bacterium SG8_51_3]
MKVIICDDQAIVRDGLVMLLKLEPDIEVVGTAGDGAEAVEMIADKGPDLILMDLKMPIMNGVEATRQIRMKYPEVKVLVLTTYADDEWVFDAIQAGASGYLLKDTPREELIRAVRGTITGKTYVDPSIAGKVLDQVSSHQTQPATLITSKLTEREIEVLRLIAKGLNNTDIADQLFLSDGTVRNHVSAILAKLGVSDRTQAAVIAIQHGLK